MNEKIKEQYTKYEIARIIGARALQIAMDAPILLKISENELKELKYDSIKIAEKELDAGALPITIHRPMPRTKKERLVAEREDKISDEELVEKEQEVEKEIVEDATELGFVAHDDEEAVAETAPAEEQ